MSHQRQSSRPPTESRQTEKAVGEGRRSVIPSSAILGVLILGISFLGACRQEEREGTSPEPGPTITATSLPLPATITPLPPTVANTPTAIATETATATPPPTVTATGTATVEAAMPANEALVTVQGDMNVRVGPGTDYDIVGGATVGQEFGITGTNQDGDWWQIDFEGQSGWIYAPFVTAAFSENVPIIGGSMTQTPVPGATTEAATPEAESPLVTILGDLNIRQGPGTDDNVIGGANAGEEFAITGKSADGDWWQIDYNGQSGWVYAPYVTAINVENVPVIGDSQTQTPIPEATSEAGTPAAESPVVTIHGDINIRQGPGTDFDRVGGATEGEEFNVTGRSADGEWWQIDFDGQSAWIYAPFVTAANVENVPIIEGSESPTPVPTGTTVEATPAPSGPVATVDDDLNIREGPGTEFDRIGGVTVGQEFDITGKSSDGEWWQIDFDGQSGWISATYVTATNAENVPVVESVPTPTPTSTPEAQGANSAEQGQGSAVANINDGDALELRVLSE